MFAEVVYTQGIYTLLRLVWDYTIGWLPFPVLYVFVPGLIVWGIRKMRRRQKTSLPWYVRLRRILLNVLGGIGVILFMFYFSWGFNYPRVSLENHISMEVDSLTADELREEFALATEALLRADSSLGQRETAISQAQLPEHLEAHLRDTERKWLQTQGLVAPGRPRGRRLFPQGMLMQLGASGIYIPFVGEGHIDAALPPAMQPFTMAHELGHAFGFGDEGTCNFLGWITCISSDNPSVRYAGHLAYWRQVTNRLAFIDREYVIAEIATLPPGIQSDLAAIKAVRERYPGFFPKLSTAIYNEYLQTQGIEEGILSYARVIHLARAWRRKQNNSAKH